MSDNDQKIDYDALTKDALRGVVKQVLRDIEKNGLPGEHHLFISFDTEAEGVVLSKRLREQYPHEMTVVLQHRFWDLEVHDDRFQVKLTFDAIPERLSIPYKAIKVFYDPSVHYSLQFAVSDITTDAMRRPTVLSDVNTNVQDGEMPTVPDDFIGDKIGRDASPAAQRITDSSASEGPGEQQDGSQDSHATGTAKPGDNANGNADREGDEKTGTAEIVELDAFRKR